MQFGERNAGTPRVGDELTNQRAGLLRAFPGAPSWRELPHKRPGAMANFDEALRLEIAIGLGDRGGIDAQLRGELPHRWQRRGTAKRAGGDRETDALGDLDVERNGTAGIDIVEHRPPAVTVYWYSRTVVKGGLARAGPHGRLQNDSTRSDE